MNGSSRPRGTLVTAAVDRALSYLVDPGDGVPRMAAIDEIANMLGAGAQRPNYRVGTRLPNLAGLFDMVGNAGEITHDLFFLIRPDGTHGARGGFVLRGGGRFTPRTVIGATRRTEQAFYDARGEG